MALKRRKKGNIKAIDLPKPVLREIQETISNAFVPRLLKGDNFHIHGEIYPDELVMSASLQHEGSIRWTTAYASIDHNIGKAEMEPKIYALVDFFGDFFSTFFENDRQVDFEDEWSAYERNGFHFFIRINRDNIELEQQSKTILPDED